MTFSKQFDIMMLEFPGHYFYKIYRCELGLLDIAIVDFILTEICSLLFMLDRETIFCLTWPILSENS